jgi:probable rRNA maturation factor
MTGMNVSIASRQRVRKINRRLLKQITTALLADLRIEKAELGIHLVAAPEMTRLNEKFLRHAGATDVITFDYQSSEFGVRSSEFRLHSEIFVCVDEAILQARKFGTSWQSEVVRYIVHGILHLLGFDDSSAGARRKMKRAENRRLRSIGRRFPLSKL